MELLKKIYKDEQGQGATEYMVLLASVVAALLGVAYTFKDKFSAGVSGMGTHVQSNLEAGFAK